MKAVVAAFNQEKAFSVITNLRMAFFEALLGSHLDSLGQSCVGCDCSVLCYMLHAVATEPEQCHLPCVRCCNPAHYNTLHTGKC